MAVLMPSNEKMSEEAQLCDCISITLAHCKKGKRETLSNINNAIDGSFFINIIRCLLLSDPKLDLVLKRIQICNGYLTYVDNRDFSVQSNIYREYRFD